MARRRYTRPAGMSPAMLECMQPALIPSPRGAAGAAFDPLVNITTWGFYLDANLGVTLGTSPNVTNWADQAANGNDALNGIQLEPDLVSGSINSLDSIDFNGANTAAGEGLVIADDATVRNLWNGGGHLFSVVKTTGAHPNSLGFIVCKGAASGSGWILYQGAASGSTHKLVFTRHTNSTSGTWTTNNFVLTNGTAALVDVSFNDGSLSNDPTISIDGTPVAITETTTPLGTYDSDSGLGLGVGCRDTVTTARSFAGEIGMLGMSSEIISGDDYSSLVDFLKTRWGIS